MKKIIEKGSEFVSKESKRLQSMVDAGKIKLDKLDEFFQRINVLKYVLVWWLDGVFGEAR